MDVDDLRAAMTVLSFVAFLGVVAWAYGRGRGDRFSAAARLPFDDDPESAAATSKQPEG